MLFIPLYILYAIGGAWRTLAGPSDRTTHLGDVGPGRSLLQSKQPDWPPRAVSVNSTDACTRTVRSEIVSGAGEDAAAATSESARRK